MALTTKEKRASVLGVARSWMRDLFPSTPDEEWRMSVGNSYGGNALSPSVVVFKRTLLLGLG